MRELQDNDGELERTVFQRYAFAKGLRCPDCWREIQHEDVWSRGNDVRIVCDRCDTTLFYWKA
jgi:hypothetical protein